MVDNYQYCTSNDSRGPPTLVHRVHLSHPVNQSQWAPATIRLIHYTIQTDPEPVQKSLFPLCQVWAVGLAYCGVFQVVFAPRH
jgi:hypothetical protein